jgi:formylmethanofuran dehydrogenase subunit E
MVYTYFDKALLDELFKNDEEDKLKTSSKKKNQAEEAEKDQDAISKSFVIEEIKVDDKGNTVVFCSKMNNYSYEVCTTDANGRTTCRTVYKCAKSNVTVFKLNKEGEIVWSSNIDRSATFGGWNVYDLRVIEDEDNYYVSYASSFKVDAEEKTKKTRKNTAETIDQMEYAVFDKESGANQKKSVRINEEEAKKSEKKRCSATDIRVFNDKYYLISRKRHIAPWIFTTCLCPPVFLIMGMFTQAGQIEDAYIGKIELVK